MNAVLKGKMVRNHRKPVIAVNGDDCRNMATGDSREGAVTRMIRKPESLPVNVFGLCLSPSFFRMPTGGNPYFF